MKKLFTLLSTVLVVGLNAQTITLSQNTDDVITGTNSVGCPGGDNQWARVFNLSDFGITGNFTIESGRVGVQSAGVGDEMAIISIFEVDNAFPFGTFSMLGTQDIIIPVGSDLTYIEYTFDEPVAVSSDVESIAVEVAVPLGFNYFIGGTAAETSDSWLWSSNCGVNDYTTATDIGFPDAHFYITVTGTLEGMGTVELGGKTLSIYPNPATDVVNVSLADGLQVQSVEVVNMAGQSVYSAKAANSINVSFLPAGVYVVRVKDNKGVTHMNKVVVK